MAGSPDPLLIIGQQVGLVAIVVVLIAGIRRLDVAPLRSQQQVLTGLVFGLGAVLAMQTRITLLPDAIYDTPSVMMALSGLVCGPWSALVTGALAAAYLLWLGGDGVVATLASIVGVGLAGTAFYAHLQRRQIQFEYCHLPGLAAVTTAIAYASLLLLPSEIRADVFGDLWIRQLLRNVIGTALLGGLLIEERRRREMAKALADAAEFARRQAEQIRTAEEQLRQSQKMQVIGQLTGGIAHDFNNLLVVILGNAEVLADEVKSPRHKELAEQILGSGERAADLTRKLLAFGRRQTLQKQLLDLSEVSQGMESLLRRTLTAWIDLDVEADGPALAHADRTLLESAILNLAINARDAMPTGGRLTIRSGERLAARGEDDLVPGEPVVFVSVADTGSGMAPEILEHAFEPFFTTKGVGEGSGLGLSMVYGFAKQSGGYARIESVVGRGTIVTIVLRAAGQAARPSPPRRQSPVGAELAVPS